MVWIKGISVNFISEAKSVSMQDVVIVVTCSSKVMQWTDTVLSKLATFPFIHWVTKENLTKIATKGKKLIRWVSEILKPTWDFKDSKQLLIFWPRNVLLSPVGLSMCLAQWKQGWCILAVFYRLHSTVAVACTEPGPLPAMVRRVNYYLMSRSGGQLRQYVWSVETWFLRSNFSSEY